MMTVGPTPGTDPESLVHSRYIVIWACNVISTNLHLWPIIAEARRRGAKGGGIDPMRNRTAEGQLAHAEIQGNQIATHRQQLEQLIQVEVRNALQSVTTAEARLRSAAVARENAEQQYESEKRRLDVGQSTVFLVLERQTALTIARGNELRAQTDLNKAIAELQRATGNSLGANNVTLK